MAEESGPPSRWSRGRVVAAGAGFLALTAAVFTMSALAGQHTSGPGTVAGPSTPANDDVGPVFATPSGDSSLTVSRSPSPRPSDPSTPSTPTTRTPKPSRTSASPTGVPKAPASEDLALDRPVSVSSTTQDFAAAHVTDGHQDTYWEAGAGFPQTLTVDLGRVQTVGRIELELPGDSDWNQRSQTITVLGRRTGTTWSTLAGTHAYPFDANSSANDTVAVSIPTTTTRYVRLRFSANSGWSAAQLSELRVYS